MLRNDGGLWRYVAPAPTGVSTAVSHRGTLLIARAHRVSPDYRDEVYAWENGAWRLLLGAEPAYDPKVGLFSHGDDLILTGGFRTVDEQAANGVLAWDGETWRSLGQHAWFSTSARGVRQGRLVLSGIQYSLNPTIRSYNAEWDGTAWRTLDTNGAAPGVLDSVEFHGQFIVGGTPASSPLQFDGLAAYGPNGGWATIGVVAGGSVRDLEVHGDELFAGGSFTGINGVPIRGVARWAEGGWEPVGGGIPGDVTRLISLGEELVAVGTFSVAGGVPATGIAAWDGAAWRNLSNGPPFGIAAMTLMDGVPVVAGNDANGTAVFARWSTAGWSVFTMLPALRATSLAEYKGTLYVGADGHTYQSGVKYWNGTEWRNSTFNGTNINLIAPVGDELAVVSWYTDVVLGSEQNGWRYLFPGLETCPMAIAPFGDSVAVGGMICYTDALRVRNVQNWDGDDWAMLGGGLLGVDDEYQDHAVTALEWYHGELYAGGYFGEQAQTHAAGVAVLRDGAWTYAFTGEPVLARTMKTIGDSLYVTNGADSSLTRWDGVALSPIPGYLGVDSPLYTNGHELLVGAWRYWATVEGRPVSVFARWAPEPAPWFLGSPRDASVVVGSTAEFTAEPAPGYDWDAPLDLRWFRDGVEVSDGPGGASAGGGVVEGAHTSGLVIRGARRSDAGSYACVAANECGSGRTTEAELAVDCEADLNRDGTADQTDVAYLASLLSGGGNPAGIDPDVDGDGQADQGDLAALIHAIAGGGCP